MQRLFRSCIVVLFFYALCGAQAAFANEQKDLQQIKQQISEKQRLKETQQAALTELQASLASLRKQSIAQAARNLAVENQLLSLETQEKTLTQQQQQTQVKLEETAAKLQQTLKTLQRIGRQPTAALLFSGAPPLDTVRSGSLMANLLHKCKSQTTIVQQQLDALTLLQQQLAATKNDLVAQKEDLKKQQEKLEALTTERRALQKKARQTVALTAQELNGLRQKSANLEQLIANLEADAAKKAQEAKRLALQDKRRVTSEQTAPETDTNDEGVKKPLHKGGFIFPVAGRVTTRFGEINPFGTKSKGITIQARQQGVVISPAAGKVIFAGSFRGVSKVVIIKHHSPYHSVIMGMALLDIKTGDTVEAGEPIGKMGKQVLDLYLELRRNGEQFDPNPWLAAQKNS